MAEIPPDDEVLSIDKGKHFPDTVPALDTTKSNRDTSRPSSYFPSPRKPKIYTAAAHCPASSTSPLLDSNGPSPSSTLISSTSSPSPTQSLEISPIPTPSQPYSRPISLLTEPPASRSVLSLICIQSKDTARRTEILLPTKYYRFYWTCCHIRQKGGIFTQVKTKQCHATNNLHNETCKKCGHVICDSCGKFALNSDDIDANLDAQANGNAHLMDAKNRLTGAYLMNWEDNGANA